MAYLDTRGLNDLWARIGAVFARLTQAAGSLALSGTSLILTSCAGGQLSSVDLNGTFATDQEVQQAIQDGTQNMLTRTAADGRYARGLTYIESTKQLTLRDGNGNALSTVTLS